MNYNVSSICRTVFLISLFACAEGETQNINPGTPISLPTETDASLFSNRQDRGVIENAAINEASGLVVSRTNANALWTHNDSGDDARVFLLGDSGQNLGVFYLENISNRDWEDMAIAEDPSNGKTYLYVAEIGDNFAVHSSIFIYRFEEPDISGRIGVIQDTIPASDIETYELQYEDGARDAESLLIDETGNGHIYIVTKREARVGIYSTTSPLAIAQVNVLAKQDSLNISFFVAGDSANGNILLKTYSQVFYWPVASSPSLGNTFRDSSPKKLPYTAEPQGESIAWKPDGSGYYTLSEANGQAVHLYYYERL